MDKPAKRAILALALVPALLACPSSDAWADDAPAADAPQRWASPLQTTRGTFSIGGSASVSYATIVGVDPPYPGALVRDQAHLSFAIAPSIGVFVADDLELGLGLSAGVDTSSPTSQTFSLSLGLRYYIGSWWLRPMIGLAWGIQFAAVSPPSSQLESRMLLSFEVGLAVPLGHWVALTFALMPAFEFPLSDQLTVTTFRLRTSLLGVRVFF